MRILLSLGLTKFLLLCPLLNFFLVTGCHCSLASGGAEVEGRFLTPPFWVYGHILAKWPICLHVKQCIDCHWSRTLGPFSCDVCPFWESGQFFARCPNFLHVKQWFGSSAYSTFWIILPHPGFGNWMMFGSELVPETRILTEGIPFDLDTLFGCHWICSSYWYTQLSPYAI